MASNKLSSLGLILAGIWATSATAEVVRIDVSTRADVAGSAAYGAAGPYEKVRGTLHFAVDPSLPVNQIVTDVALTPPNYGGPSRVQGGLLPAEAEGRRPRQRRAAVRGFESRPQGHSADDEPSGRQPRSKRGARARRRVPTRARLLVVVGRLAARPAARRSVVATRLSSGGGRRDGARAQRFRRAHARRPRLLARRRRPRGLPCRPRERRAHLDGPRRAARCAANDSARRLAVRARRRQRQRRGRSHARLLGRRLHTETHLRGRLHGGQSAACGAGVSGHA